MADGTRLKSMETQIQQLQQFADNTRKFMKEARKKQDDYQRSIEELGKMQQQSIADLGKKTDCKFEELTTLMPDWMSGKQSPNPSPAAQNQAPANQTATISTPNSGGPGLLGSGGRPLGNFRLVNEFLQRGTEQGVEELQKSTDWVISGDELHDTNTSQETTGQMTKNRQEFGSIHKVFDEMSIRRTGAYLQIEEIQTHQLRNSNKEVDVVEEFNKLTQMDDVEQYTEKFEELRASMLTFNPTLSEAYFVTSYISGLKQEIKNLVKLNRPKTLAAAYEEARMQFDAIQAFVKLGEIQGEFSCSSIRDKTEAEIVGDSMKTATSSQENKTEQPFSGEFSTKSIPCSNRPSNFDVVIVGNCPGLSKTVADFGNFSMGFLENPGAYQLFEEMPLKGFNVNNASVLQENVPKGCRSWSFDPGGTKNLNLVVLKDSLGIRHLELHCSENIHRGTKALIEEMIFPDCTLKKGCDSMIFLGFDELRCGLDYCFGSNDLSTFDPRERIEFSLQTLVILVFDPGGICLHQFGLTIMDDARHLGHYLLLRGGHIVGLLLIHSVWVNSGSLVAQRLVFDRGGVPVLPLVFCACLVDNTTGMIECYGCFRIALSLFCHFQFCVFITSCLVYVGGLLLDYRMKEMQG